MNTRPPIRWLRIVLTCGLIGAACVSTASVTSGAEVPAELVGLNVSVPAEKQLAVFDELVAVKEWEAALDLIDRLLLTDRSDTLVRVEAGRFLDLRDAIQQRLSALPEAGLKVYRRRADPVAQRLLDRGLAEQDEALFQRIAEEYAATSMAPRAVRELVQRAWRRGEVETALRHSTARAAEVTPALAGASTDFDLATARTWETRCHDWLLESRSPATAAPPVATSLGEMKWYRPATLSTWPDPGRALAVALASDGTPQSVGAPRDLVVIHDGWQVRALREGTGQAYWPTEIENDSGTLIQSVPPDEGLVPKRIVEGWLDRDQYYAVVGDRPAWSQRPLLTPRESSLSALDLGAGQGRVRWRVEARELPEPGWEFLGAPCVVGTRIIVPIGQAGAQVQLAIAAWETDTGRLAWWQRIGTLAGQAGVPVPAPEVCGLGDTIAVRTSLGVVLALDADTGRIRWATTSLVPSSDPPAVPLEAGLCCEAGRILALDADGVLVRAFSVVRGTELWSQSLLVRARGLTLARRGRLLVYGAHLLSVVAATGHPQWQQGLDDPATAGLGAPIEAGQTLYWLTRDGLWGVETATGQLVERHRLTTGPLAGPARLNVGRQILTVALPTGVWGLALDRDEITPASPTP